MEKPARYKSKHKKQPAAKPKTTKKRKSDGPTCSMFLSDLRRKLSAKNKQDEESPRNIVQTLLDNITNALPFKIAKKSPQVKESPMKLEVLQTFAPELVPNDTISVPHSPPIEENIAIEEQQLATVPERPAFRMPKMPLVSSEVLKVAAEKRKRSLMHDAAVNTGDERDLAAELAKHVSTLKKISLIAEEFNQKTAKNLKDIVDSVRADLIIKLEEVQAEQKTHALAQAQVEALIMLEKTTEEQIKQSDE